MSDLYVWNFFIKIELKLAFCVQWKFPCEPIFYTQVLIMVTCVAIRNFIRNQQEWNWLFKQYAWENLIVIDSDSKNDEGFGIPPMTTQ